MRLTSTCTSHAMCVYICDVSCFKKSVRSNISSLFCFTTARRSVDHLKYLKQLRLVYIHDGKNDLNRSTYMYINGDVNNIIKSTQVVEITQFLQFVKGASLLRSRDYAAHTFYYAYRCSVDIVE